MLITIEEKRMLFPISWGKSCRVGKRLYRLPTRNCQNGGQAKRRLPILLYSPKSVGSNVDASPLRRNSGYNPALTSWWNIEYCQLATWVTYPCRIRWITSPNILRLSG